MMTVTNAIKGACAAKEQGMQFFDKPEFPVIEYEKPVFKMAKAKKLSEVDMDKSLTDEEYAAKLEKYQTRLFELQNRC